VARTTVSNWEIDRNYPDLGMVVRLSEVLDISLNELLKGGSNHYIMYNSQWEE